MELGRALKPKHARAHGSFRVRQFAANGPTEPWRSGRSTGTVITACCPQPTPGQRRGGGGGGRLTSWMITWEALAPRLTSAAAAYLTYSDLGNPLLEKLSN